mgnify:CR=1 FL=1
MCLPLPPVRTHHPRHFRKNYKTAGMAPLTRSGDDFKFFFFGVYFRLGIYGLLNRGFKFFGNIRSYAIDFPIFHSYLNRIKT